MEIAIEEIWEIHERRVEINTVPLDEISFTQDGKPVEIDPKIIKEFVFTGLNNFDFITSGYYKSKAGY